MKRFFVLAVIAILAIDCLEISVIHINDFHDRFEEQSETSGICRKTIQCHGGFSRMYSKIQNLIKTRKNPLLMNAGDNFKGTLWYSIFKWNVTQRFMNLLPFTAYTLGNHEFDDGIAGVVPFIKTMKAPLVLTNVDDSLEPDFQNLYNKSIIVEVEGKRIGIIGVILSTANKMSLTEKLKLLDEVESVNAEAKRLMDNEGVFTIIVVSHSGYEKEMEIAKKAVKGISVIVGGHSLLYNGIPPDMSIVRGPYPTVINREVDNGTVLVVQSSCYTKYLGDLVVNYDDQGEITTYKGNSIHLDHSLPKDKAIDDLLKPYKELVTAKGELIVGSTEVYLNISDCRYAECNIGNFIADAMLNHCKNCSEIYGALSLMHVGGLRTSIEIGNITYNDLVSILPFDNTFDVSDVRGALIKTFFEQTTIPHYKSVTSPNVNLVQVSGCKVVYNLKNPIGNRVKSIQVLRGDGKYEDLDVSKDYKVITASYVTRGGDGFQVISDNLRNTEKGQTDVDIVADYLKGVSPLRIGKEGRLLFE